MAGLWTLRVDKSIHGDAQARLTRLLREARRTAGLRQSDVAEALKVPQSFVSKYESGERRLDLIELDQVCVALEVDLLAFVAAFLEGQGGGI